MHVPRDQATSTPIIRTSKPPGLAWTARVSKMRTVILFQFISCFVAWSVYFFCPSSLRDTADGRLMWGVIMWAPAISSMACRHRSHLSLCPSIGSANKMLGMAFYIIPMILLLGIATMYGDKIIFQSLSAGLPISGFVMTLGEELGWRGFLSPHLSKRYSPPVAWMITGCLWEFWHLPFRNLQDPIMLVGHAAVTVALSCLLGYMAKRHNNLVICVTLHLWANLAGEFRSKSCFITLCISVVLWCVMSVSYRSRSELSPSAR